MIQKLFLWLTVMSITSIASVGYNSLQAQKPESDGLTEKGKTVSVRINYMENGKIIPETDIYLLYYDSDKSQAVEKSGNTGNGKTVSFDVPVDKDGASYPFVFRFTKEDVNKAKEMIKTTRIRAYRTPAGDNCEFLELSVTKDGGVFNNGCAIQMWSMGKR
jgi:hypothetical protein